MIQQVTELGSVETEHMLQLLDHLSSVLHLLSLVIKIHVFLHRHTDHIMLKVDYEVLCLFMMIYANKIPVLQNILAAIHHKVIIRQKASLRNSFPSAIRKSN